MMGAIQILFHEQCSGNQSSDLRGAALPIGAFRVLRAREVKACSRLLFGSFAVMFIQEVAHGNPPLSGSPSTTSALASFTGSMSARDH